MRALNPLAPSWYTPRDDLDLPEGQRTRFRIRGLDGVEQGYLAPEIRFGEQGQVVGLTGKGLELALGYGLKDWENFANNAGPVPYARANFNLIDHQVRVELAFQILIASYLQPEEKKT